MVLLVPRRLVASWCHEWAHCLASFDNLFGSGNKASGSHDWCDSDGSIRSVKIIHNFNYEFKGSVTFPPYSKLTLLIDTSHRCYDLALAISPTWDPNPSTSPPSLPLSPVTKTKQRRAIHYNPRILCVHTLLFDLPRLCVAVFLPGPFVTANQ